MRRPGRGRPAGSGAQRRGAAAPTQARLLAFRILSRVESSGAFADRTLHAALGRCQLGPADRGLVTELVQGTVRWRGRLDYLIGQVLERELASLEPRVVTLLRLGAYQLCFAERIPPSAAVDQTVRCARAAGLERATGLVNATLRALATRSAETPLPAPESDPQGHLVHALSLPPWLAQRLLELLGPEQALRFAAASNQVAPVTARVDPRKRARDALLAELRSRLPDARACPYAPLGIRLGLRGDPGRDPAFLAGLFTLQDEGSQLVLELLDPQPGERVLDVCAAPGTKATGAAERVGPNGRVIALDRSARRLAMVERDARRLGLSNLGTAPADSTQPLPAAAPEGSFDRVLADVPCSGLGTLRRHPDARWRLAAEQPAELSRTQLSILRRAAGALRPGGVLVYSTCTVLPEENESVVEALLQEREDLRRAQPGEIPACLRPLLSEAGELRTWPHTHDTDAFYAVRLVREA